MQVTRMATQILNRAMAQSDERTKLEADIISGIEEVKTQAWETLFRERITSVRAQELTVLWQGFKLTALNTLILQAVPTVVTIATFALYVLLGHTLTATKAFTALSLFSVLRFPLFQLPMVISLVSRGQVALGRLKVWPAFAPVSTVLP
jgi:ATP-binding cassette, subfamily C (CFTR/MRP), member 1